MNIRAEVPCYETMELILDSNAEYVDFRKPDGTVERRDTFSYQPVDISYDGEGLETVTPVGTPRLLCRYTPDMTGSYTLCTVGGGKTLETQSFQVTPSPQHGYIGVSRKDRRYFAYSDGTPFFSVGINLAFPTEYTRSSGNEFGRTRESCYMGLRQYERWFRQCHENGIHVVRLWLGHAYFNPETQQIRQYDLTQFSKIDEMVKLAHKYQIKLKLTLEQFRYFRYETAEGASDYEDDIFRKFNKRLYDGSRRCQSVKEWLSEGCWIEAWLDKVNEVAKRYSGDTAIFAIELWNEMNCVEDSRQNIVEWNRKVLPRVKRMFPKQLVVNSLGSLDCDSTLAFYRAFCWDACDFLQIHRYLDPGAAFTPCTVSPIEAIREGFSYFEKTDSPVFLAETGAVSPCHSGPFKYYVNDHRGMLLADAVYMPVFLKSCGVGNMWHWDERYIEAKNLYHLYRPIRALTDEVNFPEEGFVPEDCSTHEAYVFLLVGRKTVIGYIRNRDDCWQKVLRDLEEPVPVDRVSFDSKGFQSVRLFPVWKEETAEASVKDGAVTFRHLKYGSLFMLS